MTIPDFLLGRRAALAALALGATAAVAAIALAGAWLLSGADTQSDRLHELALLQARAESRPQVERALSVLRLQAASHPALLRGESDAIVQAALQSDIKSLVEADGGVVRSAFALPAVAADGLTLISVQYDITVPITKLRQLTYGIESHVPYLFVSAVDVTAPAAWPADPKAAEPRVEMRWTVSGYRWSAGP